MIFNFLSGFFLSNFRESRHSLHKQERLLVFNFIAKQYAYRFRLQFLLKIDWHTLADAKHRNRKNTCS